MSFCRIKTPRLTASGILLRRARPRGHRGIVVLGIETSCDDTSVALLRHDHGARAALLYHRTVTSDNRLHGGIHPLISLDSHRTHLAPLLEDALRHLPAGTPRPDLVVATRGPGMRSSLAVGLDTGKGLAVAWRVPFIGANHMLGHALTHRLAAALEKGQGNVPTTDPPADPTHFYTLLVSGGHTLLLRTPHDDIISGHSIIAETIDLAAGDMLDKCARRILPTSLLSGAKTTAYARTLEEFVFSSPAKYDYYPPGTEDRLRQDEMLNQLYPWHPIPTPFMGTASKHNLLAYSFSGIGSTVDKVMDDGQVHEEDERRWLGRQVMQTTFEHLARRIVLTVKQSRKKSEAEQRQLWKQIHANTTPPPPFTLKPEGRLQLVIGGGVAANSLLRHVLKIYLESELNTKTYPAFEVELIAPPVKLCTDNAAMIAWAGLEMWNAGWRTSLEVRPVRKWSLDSTVVAEADTKRRGVKEEEKVEDEKEARGIFGVEGWVRREDI
ncbi:glycoprotease pgp1 [Peziza echinospora]|nr:glycoprotease pgp1 [Peziza echinospora]